MRVGLVKVVTISDLTMFAASLAIANFSTDVSPIGLKIFLSLRKSCAGKKKGA